MLDSLLASLSDPNFDYHLKGQERNIILQHIPRSHRGQRTACHFNVIIDQQPVQNVNQFTQIFQNETTKKQEKMCEVGFWLSLFGLICSFMGVAYGVIIYILNFYFASQGLKTRKRGKATATILLSIVSILIIIFQLVSA